MRKALLVAAAASTLLTAGLAVPAGAAGTTTTFTLTAGALNVSEPVSRNLGSGSVGASLSNTLGAVTVTDQRGALIGTWTASVSSTSFVTGDATPGSSNLTERTIPASAVTYAPPVLDAVTNTLSSLTTTVGSTTLSGIGVFTPGLGGTLDQSRTAFSAAATVGNTSASWNPTLTVAVPSTAVVGSYSGTVTHSVA